MRERAISLTNFEGSDPPLAAAASMTSDSNFRPQISGSRSTRSAIRQHSRGILDRRSAGTDSSDHLIRRRMAASALLVLLLLNAICRPAGAQFATTEDEEDGELICISFACFFLVFKFFKFYEFHLNLVFEFYFIRLNSGRHF